DGELAGVADGRALRVAEIVQPVDQLAIGERLSAPQLQRPREDARAHRLALSVEAGVDELGEARVVVTGDEEGEDERNRERQRRQPDPPFAPPPRDANPQPETLGHSSTVSDVLTWP